MNYATLSEVIYLLAEEQLSPYREGIHA